MEANINTQTETKNKNLNFEGENEMETVAVKSTVGHAEALIAQGGKYWEKNGKRRVYFNPSAWGLKLYYYKSGHISGAEINGETISNSEAARCVGVKVWYDLNDGKFYAQGLEQLHSTAQDAIRELIRKLQAKL